MSGVPYFIPYGEALEILVQYPIQTQTENSISMKFSTGS